MHVYQGYKHTPYEYPAGTGQRSGGTTRQELERRYAESHVSSPTAQKPHKRDWLPFVVAGLAIAVALVSVGAWMFGFDMLVPLLAMNLVLVGGYVGWKMM